MAPEADGPPIAAGYGACDPSVLVGRPASVAELVQQVRAFERVKAVGVGHRHELLLVRPVQCTTAFVSICARNLSGPMSTAQLEP